MSSIKANNSQQKAMTKNIPSTALKGRQYVSPGRSFALRSAGLGRSQCFVKVHGRSSTTTKNYYSRSDPADLSAKMFNCSRSSAFPALAFFIHGATFFLSFPNLGSFLYTCFQKMSSPLDQFHQLLSFQAKG